MPDYKPSVKKRKISKIKKGILECIKRDGVATLGTLTEHFGLKDKHKWWYGLRKKALEELLDKRRIVRIVHHFSTGASRERKFYVLNEPELVRAVEVAKLHYGGGYHPEANLLLEIDRRIKEGSPLVFSYRSITTDPVNKIAKNFSKTIEIKTRYENGKSVSEIKIKNKGKFEKIIKTLKKTLELRNLYRP